jgi:Tol biopolymer transport system component
MAPTLDGVLLGTAPYMSPEQARGKAVDKRADIWAFGCVLFEMLTGHRAFGGETTSDTIVAILEREPDWNALPAGTPASLNRLLQRCLDKDPKRRLRDIADAQRDIDDGARQPNAVTASPVVVSGRGPLFAGGVVTGIVAAAIGAAMLLRAGPTPAAPEFSRVVRLTSGPAHEVAPVVSADGKWVAYLSDEGGTTHVWVKFVAGGEAINLTASSGLDVGSGTGIGGLDVAPDGTRLAVAARPRGSVSSAFSTWEIPAPLPGVPHKLLNENFLGARWSLDGTKLTFIKAGAASGDALFVADADGGNRREIITPRDGMHVHWPAWSRDGFVYFIRTFTTVANLDAADIYRIDARGTAPMEPVVQSARRTLFPLPMPDGNGLIYAANPNTAELRLWWRPFTGGPARQMTTGVGEYAEPRISADGRTLVCTLYELRQSLTRIPVHTAPATPTAITAGYDGDLDPTISPAGDRLVFSSSRDGNRHLWSARLDGSEARPLTSGSSYDDRPAFSPDGQQIAFVSDRTGARAIWAIPADGGPPRKVVDAETTGGLTWSRDGTRIVYAAGAGAGPGLWSVPATGGQPQPIPTPRFAAEPAWSPTDDVIAFMSVSRGNGPSFTDVAFVDPSGKPLDKSLPKTPGGNGFSNGMLAWAPDGRRLAIANQQSNSAASIWMLDLALASEYTKIIDLPPGPRVRGITWTHDGSSLIIGKHDWTSDIVLMDRGK